MSEAVLSVIRPSNAEGPAEARLEVLEKIYAITAESIFLRENREPLVYAATARAESKNSFGTKKDLVHRELFSPRSLIPGRTLGTFHERWARLAAGSRKSVIAGEGSTRPANGNESFRSVGTLASDPKGLYDSFEIRVNKRTFVLSLIARRGAAEKILYESKVGLGSPEFPTPTGSFFITKIFDDKPIWIPPPDKLWAWGATPSRSVYGGHMMPLLRKRIVRASTSSEITLDKISPKVRMVDGGGYRIHGTDSPWSVGSNQSHGCVRMRNPTVKKLADALKMYVGTTTRSKSPNGPYVNLARPVRIVLHRTRPEKPRSGPKQVTRRENTSPATFLGSRDLSAMPNGGAGFSR
ncbi:L,D-transpeptidase [Thermodesulfobacteriota bacterium]